MKRVVLLVATCLLSSAMAPARGEVAPKPAADAPMVTILTASGVSVSVTFQGDYGPNRIEGMLLALPNEPIRAREGKQVRDIELRHLQELQRTPLGVGPEALSTYSLQMFTGESYVLQPDKSEAPAGPQPVTITRTMQVVSVPKGVVELKTEMFGVLRIPFAKLLQLTVQPIHGALREAPSIPLPVEVLPDLTLMVPFQRLTNFHRDPMGGTTTVSFGAAEGATGRIKQMPEGGLTILLADGEERHIPLSEVVEYNLESPLSSKNRS
jgi:hypothetical protein